MKKITKILFIIVFALLLILLTGCESKSKQELVVEKTFAEMEYIESKVLVIVKNYFLGEYLDENNQIQWDLIEKEFSGVMQNSNVMVIDLANLPFSNEEIMNLENYINNVSSAIKSQTESNFISSLKDIYALVPELLNKYYSDKNIIKIKFVKSNLLNALYYYMMGDYETSINSINSAESRYLELINNKEYLEENSYKVNKNYVAIQEFKLSIEKQELTMVVQKYLKTLDL